MKIIIIVYYATKAAVQ